MNDRNYYRTLPVRDLIERGRNSEDELAIALAERLAELDFELETEGREDFRQLSRAYDEVCAELAECRDELKRNEHIYEG